jgi:hypothetical protein
MNGRMGNPCTSPTHQALVWSSRSRSLELSAAHVAAECSSPPAEEEEEEEENNHQNPNQQWVGVNSRRKERRRKNRRSGGSCRNQQEGMNKCAVEGGRKKEVDQTTLGFFASTVSQA